jgi:hypothetical protein
MGRCDSAADAEDCCRDGERSGGLVAGDHLVLSPYWAWSSTPTAPLWRCGAEKKLNPQAERVGLSVLSTNRSSMRADAGVMVDTRCWTT